jgi:hypothetical protein
VIWSPAVWRVLDVETNRCVEAVDATLVPQLVATTWWRSLVSSETAGTKMMVMRKGTKCRAAALCD